MVKSKIIKELANKELIEKLRKSKFSEDIATIEQFAAEDNRNIGRDLTFLAGNVYKNTSIMKKRKDFGNLF